jgi:hypothetical protein
MVRRLTRNIAATSSNVKNFSIIGPRTRSSARPFVGIAMPIWPAESGSVAESGARRAGLEQL